MGFTSLYFVLFVILTLCVYYSVPKKKQWVVLLISSYAYYTISDLRGLFFIVSTTLVSFFSAKFICMENKQLQVSLEQFKGADFGTKRQELKENAKKKKKTIVTFAVVLLIGVLVFLKYFGFAINNLNTVFRFLHINRQINSINLLLPLGISFYIFQSVGYVIDVYRNKYEADNNIFKYALFVSFFPQIIQGPIGRYDKLGHQLFNSRNFEYSYIRDGIHLILWGFFKKMLIADRLYIVVNEVFNYYTNYGGFVIFTSVIFYSIQIYCDFSGGIDIAHGVSKCMGIDLDENFARPFFANSVSDFWRRWHITLGSWMRDYFFYSLALSKTFTSFGKFSRKKLGNVFGKILPSSIITFISFILIGMWHGSSWKYVAFGLFNGTIISISMIIDSFLKNKTTVLGINIRSKAWHIFRVFRTFLIICIGRYFTRSATFIISVKMLKITFTNPNFEQFTSGILLQMGLSGLDYIIIFVSIIILFIVSFIQEKGIKISEYLEAKNGFIQMGVVFLLLTSIIVFGVYREGYIPTEFIYMQY